MSAPIRPGLPATTPAAPQRSGAALAAQRAFFQAAMDRAGAPAPAAAAPVPAPVAPVQRTLASAPAPATESEPLPRLGRYLDIRV